VQFNLTEGVISVQRSLVELKGGIIESKPKSTRGYRSILLPPFALEALKKHRERQERMRQGALKWQENDYVFCTSHGTPIAAANQRTAFKALLQKAGLPDIRFHDLRHSVATLLLELGTHPKIVQELLGHENIGMTMDIYSHAMPTMQKEAMAKLNELLGVAGKGTLEAPSVAKAERKSTRDPCSVLLSTLLYGAVALILDVP
jgi:integrase